ncbi:hypothetical protein ACFL1O_00335 [Patescibacteria group bacterium]
MKNKNFTNHKGKKLIHRVLTLKDVIEALAIYDVEHCRFPHNYFAETDAFGKIPELHGMVIDDQKLILIDDEQGTEIIKQTVVHELLHARHFMVGDLPHNNKIIEKVVNTETDITYLKLFGVLPLHEEEL